jgi:hypothetical protein
MNLTPSVTWPEFYLGTLIADLHVMRRLGPFPKLEARLVRHIEQVSLHTHAVDQPMGPARF